MHIWRIVRVCACGTELSCCCILSDSSSNVVIERLAVRCYHGAPLFALCLIGHNASFSHIWGWVKRCSAWSRALCCLTDKWHTLTFTWQNSSWNLNTIPVTLQQTCSLKRWTSLARQPSSPGLSHLPQCCLLPMCQHWIIHQNHFMWLGTGGRVSLSSQTWCVYPQIPQKTFTSMREKTGRFSYLPNQLRSPLLVFTGGAG